jgi:hypothetical protein
MKHDLASFRNIDINAKVRNVKIDIAGDNTYGYEIENRRYSKIHHAMKGATLCITEKLNRLFLFGHVIDVLRGLKKLDIKIHIPKNAELGTVTLKNTSGNTVVKEMECGTLDMNTMSSAGKCISMVKNKCVRKKINTTLVTTAGTNCV